MSKFERIFKKLESLKKKKATLYRKIDEIDKTELKLFEEALATANPDTASAKKSEAKKPGRKPAGRKPKK